MTVDGACITDDGVCTTDEGVCRTDSRFPAIDNRFSTTGGDIRTIDNRVCPIAAPPFQPAAVIGFEVNGGEIRN